MSTLTWILLSIYVTSAVIVCWSYFLEVKTSRIKVHLSPGDWMFMTLDAISPIFNTYYCYRIYRRHSRRYK